MPLNSGKSNLKMISELVNEEVGSMKAMMKEMFNKKLAYYQAQQDANKANAPKFQETQASKMATFFPNFEQLFDDLTLEIVTAPTNETTRKVKAFLGEASKALAEVDAGNARTILNKIYDLIPYTIISFHKPDKTDKAKLVYKVADYSSLNKTSKDGQIRRMIIELLFKYLKENSNKYLGRDDIYPQNLAEVIEANDFNLEDVANDIADALNVKQYEENLVRANKRAPRGGPVPPSGAPSPAGSPPASPLPSPKIGPAAAPEHIIPYAPIAPLVPPTSPQKKPKANRAEEAEAIKDYLLNAPEFANAKHIFPNKKEVSYLTLLTIGIQEQIKGDAFVLKDAVATAVATPKETKASNIADWFSRSYGIDSFRASAKRWINVGIKKLSSETYARTPVETLKDWLKDNMPKDSMRLTEKQLGMPRPVIVSFIDDYLREFLNQLTTAGAGLRRRKSPRK